MKKVLIFGCGGFVGEYLTKEFTSHGYKVIGADIFIADDSLKNLVEMFYKVDLLEFNEVKKLICDCMPDYIINLAAVSSVGASWEIPQRTVDVNVKGSLNILEAVRAAGFAPKILLIGSSEEYSISDTKISEDYSINANNPYGISKVMQEQFAKLYRQEYGMQIITTRTFNHTGIGQPEKFAIPSFVKQVAKIHSRRENGVISVGNLAAKRDLGDIRDMVSAYRMILESSTSKSVFNVGSGNCYRMEEILKYIISLTPQRIEIKIDKDKLRPLDNPVIWCDNSLIREEIGWEPQYSVFDAINMMFESLII